MKHRVEFRLMKLLALAVAVFLLVRPLTGGAFHHSISGAYDTSQQLKMDAIVREFHFVNPHPFLTVEILKAGKTEVWKFEMDNRSELLAIGMTESTLKPGDRISAAGSPGRSQPQTLYLRRLDRPADGFWYEQVGTEPRIRNQRR